MQPASLEYKVLEFVFWHIANVKSVYWVANSNTNILRLVLGVSRKKYVEYRSGIASVINTAVLGSWVMQLSKRRWQSNCGDVWCNLDRDSCFPLQDSGNLTKAALSHWLQAAGGSHGDGKASLPQEGFVFAEPQLYLFLSLFFHKSRIGREA